MNPNTIYIAAILVVLAIATKILRRYMASHELNEALKVNEPAAGDCGGCDGTDSKCEQECMMEAATKEVEYFDDEELDRFARRASDDYTDEEAEEFREILYSMKTEEVKDWNRSLILREINVPDQIKDELVLLLQE
ncbi:MAG: hypothetical protein MJZ29_01935 [Bacteroidaceae bacterium]|nr:hypothetical protein [Bacteroidaceae bacterium]